MHRLEEEDPSIKYSRDPQTKELLLSGQGQLHIEVTVAKLNAAYNKALAAPDMREKITGPGNEVGGGTPEEFAAFIAAESKRWSALVKSANIKLE